MKVLFIGGTGIISSACASRVVELGHDLTVLVRGQSDRLLPPGVRVLNADVREPSQARSVLQGLQFDVVVDFVAFTLEHVESDLALFRGRTSQYVFISSASAYQTPPRLLPITESTPLFNPVWEYSRNKIACEERLLRAYREEGFPITLVRPSHTYDCRLIPLHGGWTNLARMQSGRPIVVHGDGTSLWVLTHHADFARGFVGLLGNPLAIGEAVHITSDELLTWDEIARSLARAMGVEPRIVHVPSEVIATHDREWGDSLLGDKTHSVIFDNTKIRRLVPSYIAQIPFGQGARQIVSFYLSHPACQVMDASFDGLLDRLCGIGA